VAVDRTIPFRSTVDTGGLRDDLESVKLGLGRDVGKLMQRAIEPLLAPTKANTPFDRDHARNHAADGFPHIRDSIQVGGASAKTATLVSTHPAAAVFEWNDDTRPAIAPRGVPLTIKSVQMAHKAADSRIVEVERIVAEGVSALVAKHGL
jgi:hypothetical protein